jgi:hypothetical protein
VEGNLLHLNRRGIFPGPSEREEEFLTRAAAKKIASQESLRELSHQSKRQNLLQTLPKLTQELFDAFPDWVNIHFSQKGLFPWEGAATWIEENVEGVKIASIQIKSSFFTRLYLPEEILAHEMVHAMRLMFEERRFEEILAFRTSKNRFRRFFGPLFAHPGETKGFVLCVLGSWLLYGAEFIFDLSLAANYLFWFPSFVLGGGLWRLFRSQKVFSLALDHLEKTIKESKLSLAVALRLSDREIEQFAQSSPEEILAFVSKEKEKSLRWNQLFSAYFQNG